VGSAPQMATYAPTDQIGLEHPLTVQVTVFGDFKHAARVSRRAQHLSPDWAALSPTRTNRRNPAASILEVDIAALCISTSDVGGKGLKTMKLRSRLLTSNLY
jgi:hypothetical protein